MYADAPGHPTIDRQLAVFAEGLAGRRAAGRTPALRHLANSAATLTRPDTHFDLVRPGIAVYGLSPIAGETYGLRPAMTARARVMLTKRVPAGTGVSYGHTYTTPAETTLAVVPLGYADGVPRHASSTRPGRSSAAGYGRSPGGSAWTRSCSTAATTRSPRATWRRCSAPATRGEPTADDWAEAVGTINYEIVTRFGSTRVPRVYDGERAS